MDSDEILKAHSEWLEGFGGERADLRNANLRWADLRNADLRHADLSEANLRWADLRWADLRNADLRHADLSEANLRWANLRNADLRNADLRHANLPAADLHNADLRNANLSLADLRHADLSEANLSEADLHNADLRNANLSGAKNLLSSIDYMKEHFEKTADGFIAYKCFSGRYQPPEGWVIQPRGIISENLNANRTTPRGCGINVATLEWVRKTYPRSKIWRVLIRWEWLCGVCVPYNTDGKIRCERVELLEVLEGEQ